MDYTMNIIINRNNFEQIYSVMRDARSRLHKMPECVLSSYKPYITMDTEFSCLQTIRKKAEILDEDTIIMQVKTSSDYTQNGRFTHSPLSGDPLTLSRGVRDFLLSGTGLYCVDLSGCEARIAGELSGDSKLIDAYNQNSLYSVDGMTRDEAKVAVLSFLNGGKDEAGIHNLFPVVSQWRKQEINSQETLIHLFDGENIERTHTYKDISKIIQGNGAALLRIALRELDEAGIHNVIHLHDAIYVEKPYIEQTIKALTKVIPFRTSIKEM